MVTTIWTSIGRRARPILGAFHHRRARTGPETGPRIGSNLGDLPRTKAALVTEQAFPRQQLVVLGRQVKRPALTPADRPLLALPARLAHGWRAALLIVRPLPPAALAPAGLPPRVAGPVGRGQEAAAGRR